MVKSTILPILLSISIVSGCEFVANRFFFQPDGKGILTQGQLPHHVQELFIETADHVELQGYLLPQTASNRILIYFHGNAGNICSRLPDLIQIHRMGLNVLGVSYRGYGKSGGKPSEDGLYLDGEAAFTFATQQLGFASDNVILLGRSLGSAVAVNTARHKGISGLILVTPLISAKACARAYVFGPVAAIAGNAFNAIDKIQHIQCPLLVIHGTNDHVIPFAMGKAVYDRAMVRKRFIAIEGANHNDLSTDYAAIYWPAISEFIDNPNIEITQPTSG